MSTKDETVYARYMRQAKEILRETRQLHIEPEAVANVLYQAYEVGASGGNLSEHEIAELATSVIPRS